MSIESNPPDSNGYGVDLIDRATQSLRDVSSGDFGPSALLLAETIGVLQRAESRRSRSLWFRPTFVAAAAAVILLIIGVSIIGRSLAKRLGGSPIAIIPSVRPAPQVAVVPPRVYPPTDLAPVPVDKTPTLPIPQVTSLIADGVIEGTIAFEGRVPARTPLASATGMPDCVRLHGGPFYDESLVVGRKGGLANVVVSVSDGLSGWLREEFPPPSEVAVLDQQKCVFVPHVVAVMVGQQLMVKNSDPMLHNVHVMAVNNPQANLGQISFAESATGPFESPEVFRVMCDVHPWMQAWVRVVDNPFFAVTGPDGHFTLHGLPPGTYTLKAWHEQLGIREQQITLVAGKGTSVDFSFNSSVR